MNPRRRFAPLGSRLREDVEQPFAIGYCYRATRAREILAQSTGRSVLFAALELLGSIGGPARTNIGTGLSAFLPHKSS